VSRTTIAASFHAPLHLCSPVLAPPAQLNRVLRHGDEFADAPFTAR
jgi:hypothetical protein